MDDKTNTSRRRHGGANGAANSPTKRARRDGPAGGGARPNAPQNLDSSFPAALVFEEGRVTFELTETQRKLWLHHPVASQRAAQFHEPFQQYRILGVIRRRLTVQKAIHGPKKEPRLAPEMPEFYRKKKPAAISQPMAKKLAQADALRNGQAKTDAQLLLDAEQIKIDWARASNHGMMQPFWDVNGQVTHLLQDPDVMPVTHLLKLFKSGRLVDDEHRDSVKSLYDGLQNVHIDTLTVLNAIVDLQQPVKELYDIPMILSYPRLKNGLLIIGIYASRLLYEIMTYKSLQCIISAFEDDSVTISQPLSYLKPCPSPVFASDDRRIVYEMEDVNDATMKGATDDTTSLYAFSNAGFLALCESHGSDTSQWSEIEAKLEPALQVNLMLHQIHGVCWMHAMEGLQGGLNSMLWEKREFRDGGAYYFSPALGQARLFLGSAANAVPPIVKGGLLCDEMGLGKTTMTLALIVATLDELKAEALAKDDHRHATLIIVPPSLVSQWVSEIEKVTGDFLVVDFFNHRTMKFETKSARKGKADVVITTYNSLEKQAKTSLDSSRILKFYSWGRVVLDEMQEIRSSTTSMAKNCEELDCDRRWMLSGTPMFEGIDDLRGELCFLRLEPFAGSLEDGFFDFAVKNRWEDESTDGLEALRVLSLVMLRRSKTMTVIDTGLPLLGLKPLTVLYEPVPQDPSERAVYCYLESLVHATIQNNGDDDATKHRTLLRLLREASVSCLLISGGMGCPTQLVTINRLVVELNRKELTQLDAYASKSSRATSQTAISCEDAIRFLSQVVETARVGREYVTNVTLGVGGGASRRDRAVDSAELQLEEAERDLLKTNRCIAVNRPKLAKARWYRVLELITTGCLPSEAMRAVSPKLRCIWNWRFVLSHLREAKAASPFPEILLRGWRPGSRLYLNMSALRAQRRWQWAFNRITGGYLQIEAQLNSLPVTSRKVRATWKWRFLFASKIGSNILGRHCRKTKLVADLALKRLHEKWSNFRWAHPHCLFLSGIPLEIGYDDIHKSFMTSLFETQGRVHVIPLAPRKRGDGSDSWSAYVQFDRKRDYDAIERIYKRVDGLKVDTKLSIKGVESQITDASEAFAVASAEFKVYACNANQARLRKAEKALRTAKLGLRIFSGMTCRSPHISCAPSIHSLRDSGPKSTGTLMSRLDTIIARSSYELSLAASEKSRLMRDISRLQKIIKNGNMALISATSAFDSLQLLKNGESGRTQCPVCLGPLGDEESSGGLVSVTPCGHLFCRGCLQSYFAARGLVASPCIACRKPLHLNDVKIIDPSSTSEVDKIETRRKTAAAQVQQAAVMLEQSNGQLPPKLWEALYLAMEPPDNAHHCAHPTYTAIPSLFLAHLNHACHLRRNGLQVAVTNTSQLTSKIRALLADIPKDEQSVVFTSSKHGVKLLVKVLDTFGLGCRCLFNGQDETTSEKAVKEWQSAGNVLVLVIQSGAAACGLTLTAASKMFIMEPFSKHEEEKQAYARLHRYGQTKEVVCKVYYSPVSVESRLLEWRKRVSGSMQTEEDAHLSGEKITYAPLRNDIAVDIDEDEANRFLLGINSRDPIYETLTDDESGQV